MNCTNVLLSLHLNSIHARPLAKMKSLHSVLFIFLKLIVSDEAARILGIFPTPSISHQIAFRPLVKELVNRGHEVIVLTTDPIYPKGASPKNLTEIDVHDMSYAEWGKFVDSSTGKKSSIYTQMKVAYDLMTDLFEKYIYTEEMQRILKNKKEKFDLILTEDWVKLALVFSHLYNAPVIQISSLGPTFQSWSVIGAPNHPLLYPICSRTRIYNLTMWEKMTELYDYYWIQYMVNSHEKKDNEMIQRIFGAEMPSLTKLCDNVHMLFLNIHPIWEGNTPVPPSVVFMGGVHQNPAKPLPKDLNDYLDSSVNGVIYMSFGTNTNPSSLPPEKIQLFVRVFSRLPYNILWKWDKEVLPGQTENIRIGKWFPQSDLLRHPNIKLFITQGGLQSTDEAITSGVPLLGIPMLADQWYNVEKYVYHKIGMQLDLDSLSEENFKDAIYKILGDKSYHENVARLRTLMHDQPQTPLERAVWWTEHVLRHGGGRHLRAPAANMHWATYYEIELVLTLLSVLFATLFLCLFAVFKFYRLVCKKYVVKVKVS